ncbi:hypothetical protein LXL04_011470 [Taraxacum kok-saghyz]
MEYGAVDIIEDTVKFLLDCEDGGEVVNNPSIYMVPNAFRNVNPSSFNPTVVAIGPLHKHDEHLQGFEVQKTTYLHNMLRRLRCVPDQTLRKCAEKVICSIERIKGCYPRSTTYDDFELCKMMVIDGCFILEFLWTLKVSLTYWVNLLTTPSIMLDLLLIENQIPFFVLEFMFECTFIASGRLVEVGSLTNLLEIPINFCEIFKGNSVVPIVSLYPTPDHILGFVHKYYQPAEPLMPLSSFTSHPKGHSAIELDRAGMKFKPNEDENCAIAMKLESPRLSCFWCKPTLRMPIVVMSDYTEMILRNLIMYEQSSNVWKYVTAYVFAMDMLIETPDDVALLAKSKVVTSYIGSNEEAANMINNLCKNVVFPKYFYYQQWEEMDAYYNSYWPYTLAVLKRTYFNNPWSIIALIAAFVLFALTIVQTIFSIKAS